MLPGYLNLITLKHLQAPATHTQQFVLKCTGLLESGQLQEVRIVVILFSEDALYHVKWEHLHILIGQNIRIQCDERCKLSVLMFARKNHKNFSWFLLSMYNHFKRPKQRKQTKLYELTCNWVTTDNLLFHWFFFCFISSLRLLWLITHIAE